MNAGRLPFLKIALVAVFACALIPASNARTQAADNSSRLTVEKIFGRSGLSGSLTHGVAWRPDGKQLSFFKSSGSGKEAKTELWVMSAPSGETHLLIAADKLDSILAADKSRPTQATGLGRHAPPQYQWAPDGGALLFQGPNQLAWFDLRTQTARTLVSGKGSIADPKISPDGRYVSFVRDHNVWLISLADGKQRPLTEGGTEEIRKGELDWVYPEELEIETAYWWSPDSTSVAYLQMDERKVTQYPLVDFESFTGEADMERYPVAGGHNPVVHVYVVPVNRGNARPMDTGSNDDIYVPRVRWLNDSRQIAIERLNRAQTQLELLFADARNGKSRVVLTEKDSYWINVGKELRFLKDGRRFLWSSERSGYRHLHLYDLSGKELKQLTSGDWEVSGVDALDEANGMVYFTATEKSPLERHLYRVKLDGTGFARVSKDAGTHGIDFAPDAAAYLDTYSNSMTPPRQDVDRADGSLISTLNENKVAELADFHLSPVDFLTVKSHDGVSLNAMMIKPSDFDPHKKYPVLVYTYGGPHAQVVLNEWTGSTFLWHEMMAQQGFIIFALDNRGSAGRGHVFEEPIHFHFGAQELSDQRDGVAWLKSQPYVDGGNIGIWGWSYGGHMTLHAMFEDQQDFKAGFAGGPVTDWHFYDTIYTERYMGLLPQNEESYRSSSPIDKVGQFHSKLLIAHGTGDYNVHFANTLALLDDLIARGKYVEVLPFPGRGHGVSDAPARILLMNHVTQFFEKNLRGHSEPAD